MAVFLEEIDSISYKDSIDCLLESIATVEGTVHPGMKVFIKPNLEGVNLHSCTDPKILLEVVRWFVNKQAKITIGDASVVGTNTEDTITALRLSEFLTPLDIVIYDLRKSKFVSIPIKDPLDPHCKILHISALALESDLIVSLAKLKTSYAATVSLSIKNLKGILADNDRLMFHRLGVHRCLCELFRCLKQPVWGIIDGLYGWDQDQSKPVGVLIGGSDCVAVDWIGSWAMNIDPNEVLHLKLASKLGLGRAPSASLIEAIKKHSVSFRGLPKSVGEFKLPSGVNILFSGNCFNCLGILELVLKRLETDGSLNHIRNAVGELNFIVGKASSIPSKWLSIAIGNCATDNIINSSTLFVRGCPPQSKLVLERFLRKLCEGNSIKNK